MTAAGEPDKGKPTSNGTTTPAGTGAAGPRSSAPATGSGAGARSASSASTSASGSSKGGGGGWLGGLVGGLLGGAAAWYGLTNYVETGADPAVEQLQTEVAELGEAVTGAGEQSARIEALESQMEALPEEEGLLTRVEDLESQIVALAGNAAPEDLVARVEALESAGGGSDNEALADLTARIDALEAGSGGGGGGGVSEDIEARLAALEGGGEESGDAQDFESRIAALESSLADRASAQTEAVDTVRTQIDDLQGQIESLTTEGSDTVSEEALGLVETRVSDLSSGLDALRQAAVAEQRVAALQSEVAALLARVESLAGSAVEADTVEVLGERLAAGIDDLDEDLGTLREATETTDTKLTDLAGQVGELQGTVPTMGDQLTGRLDDLSSRMDETATRLDEVAETVAGLQEEAGALDERIASTTGRLDAANDRRERAATVALVIGQVSAAIDQARPHGDALDALSQMAGDDGRVQDAVTALEPSASDGVPSLTELQVGLEEIAGQLVQAGAVDEDSGLFSQAAGNLSRLVSVRPVGGDVEGDTAGARVARAEAALGVGEVGRAITEIEGLDEAALDIAEEWLTRAKLRADAEKAVADLRAYATELLSAGS